MTDRESPQCAQQNPPAPPKSRRNSMPAALATGQILAIQQTTQRPRSHSAACTLGEWLFLDESSSVCRMWRDPYTSCDPPCLQGL